MGRKKLEDDSNLLDVPLAVPLALLPAAAAPVLVAVELPEVDVVEAVELPVLAVVAAPVDEAHGGRVDASVTEPLFTSS